MHRMNNERGSVFIFVTLIIVLLLIMVGLGLDTGQLAYVRSQGQAAVDAAALGAVSGLRVSTSQVENRSAGFNATNNYVESPTNKIGSSNISYIQYDFAKNEITNYSSTFADANGVRVALEQSTGSGITTPVFLTPLLNLLGFTASASRDINVSAVAVVSAIPTLPIALYDTQCGKVTKIRATSDPLETGCWTTYFDSSTSKPDVVGLMKASGDCNGAPQGAKIGDLIHLNDGNQKPDYDAASELFASVPDDQCFIVPVVQAPPAGSKTNNCGSWQAVKNWASVCPSKVVSTGNPKYIEASVTCGEDLNKTKNNLCFSHRLVRDTKAGM